MRLLTRPSPAFEGYWSPVTTDSRSYATVSRTPGRTCDHRDVSVSRIADSCGFGVPLMDFVGTRDRLLTSAKRKGSEKLAACRALKNARSIDGLPGLEPASNGINRAGAGGSKFPFAPRLRQSPFREAASTWPVLPSPS